MQYLAVQASPEVQSKDAQGKGDRILVNRRDIKRMFERTTFTLGQITFHDTGLILLSIKPHSANRCRCGFPSTRVIANEIFIVIISSFFNVELALHDSEISNKIAFTHGNGDFQIL